MKVEIEKSKLNHCALQLQAFSIVDQKIISKSGLLMENIKASVKHRLQKIHKQLLTEIELVNKNSKDLDEASKEEFMKDKSSFEWEGCNYDMLTDFTSQTNYDFDLIEEYFCEKK